MKSRKFFISCSHCGGNAEGPNRVLLNQDGDFACCPDCADAYRKRRDEFFNDIVISASKTEAWLRGELGQN